MYFTKTAIILITLGLVAPLPQPKPGANVNIKINVNKNVVRNDKHGGDNTWLNNILPNEKYDAMNDVDENLLDTPLKLPARPVPCQESGGHIQTKMCCPWYSSNPDLCTPYDECVCKEGFEGDECEHECGSNVCPFHYQPVCGTTMPADDDITFANKCQFLTSKCNNDYDGLYFLYDGACQNDTICPLIDCPLDVTVVYYDDPEMPGCKLCAADSNAPCY